MTSGVDTLEPTCTVQQAATRMAELDVGAILVGTADDLQGVLTDRDIILRLVVDARNPAEVQVAEVMSSRVFSCNENDSLEAAFQQMREHQVRRLPVRDQSGKVTGIVTLSDLASGVRGADQIEQALRQISEPHRVRHHPERDAEIPDPAFDG